MATSSTDTLADLASDRAIPRMSSACWLAGLYQQSMKDREAGNLAAASELAALAARRFPNDTEVRLFAAESLLVDNKDPQSAIAGAGGD